VPASWLRFVAAFDQCATSSCDGVTGRALGRLNPNEAFPTFGEAAGGFEVYISIGYAHVDIVTADDDETNQVIEPMLDFIGRNLQ
jgi:hypothetical protein